MSSQIAYCRSVPSQAEESEWLTQRSVQCMRGKSTIWDLAWPDWGWTSHPSQSVELHLQCNQPCRSLRVVDGMRCCMPTQTQTSNSPPQCRHITVSMMLGQGEAALG